VVRLVYQIACVCACACACMCACVCAYACMCGHEYVYSVYVYCVVYCVCVLCVYSEQSMIDSQEIWKLKIFVNQKQVDWNDFVFSYAL